MINEIKQHIIQNYYSFSNFITQSGYEVAGVITLKSLVFDENFKELIHYVWGVILAITLMILKAWLEPIIKSYFKK